jgi:hypothetical protein
MAAGAAAYPLPFLTVDFIDDALTGDEATFSAAITLLKAQTHIPVNANSGLLLSRTVSPITLALFPRHRMHTERVAALIEALYTHCGIPTTPSRVVGESGEIFIKWSKSPLWMAIESLNFPAFQTLLRCNADFDANDHEKYHDHTILHVLASRGDEAVKFLTLLPDNKTPSSLVGNPNINGNINRETALHISVVHSSNCSPEVVRLLIQKFGADPNIRNRRGALPLDTLHEMVRNERRYSWYPLVILEQKVLKIERLLQRTDRALAVLMGVSLRTRNQGSELRHLDGELAAMILDLADQ